MSDRGPSPSVRRFRRALVVFAWAMGASVVLLTAVMALQTVGDGPLVSALTWLLLPGLLLYGTIHGSLLSGGSGVVGDFLIVVVGSAALWSVLYTALHLLASLVMSSFFAPAGPADRVAGRPD
jgi:hypothetical protein